MGLRLLSVLVLVAVCCQSRTVSCNDVEAWPDATKLLKDGLGQSLDYTNLKMTQEEETLLKKYVKQRKRTTKSLIACLAMYVGGFALAALGATMALLPGSDLIVPGVAVGVPGGLGFISGAIPLAVMGAASRESIGARKALMDLAKQRAEKNRRNDVLSALMKRPVVSQQGKFVGDKPRVRSEILQPEIDAFGSP